VTDCLLNPVSSTLRILDDGAASRVDVDAVSAAKTAASLTGGSANCRFSSTAALYTGAFSSTGPDDERRAHFRQLRPDRHFRGSLSIRLPRLPRPATPPGRISSTAS
jgi:hypothetical protein